MKRFVIVTLFVFLGLLIFVGLFYAAGTVWGPLYQGEDESTRNFNVFLLTSALSVFVGARIGLWKIKKDTQS